MMKTTPLIMLAAAAGFAASAMAAAPQGVGTFSTVQGAVTVTTAEAVQRAEDGMRVADGAGIMVSSDGAATVALDNGCAITLPGSSYLALDAGLPCDELQAAAEPLFESYQQASLGDSYLMAQAPVSAGVPTAPAANNDSDSKKGGAVLTGGGIGGMTTAQTGMAIVGGGVLAAAIFSNSGSSHRGPISGE